MSITSEQYQQLMQNKAQSKKNKFHADPKYADEYRFDSQKEARFFEDLKIRQKMGKIKYFLRQVPFHLSAKPRVTYRCDFLVVDQHDRVSFFEVKGFLTDTARAKLAWTEQLYGVEINIV